MHLIFVHGPPAAGKLTVARVLSERTGLPVFHNHLVVDAVGSVFAFGSEPFVRLREQWWLAAFEQAARIDRSLIFTFAPEPTVAPDFPERARQLVEAAGGRVSFVAIDVSPQEQEKRLVDPRRAAFGKLTSVALLRELRSQFDACAAAMPASAVRIDTGAMSPDDAAGAIAAKLALPTKT